MMRLIGRRNPADEEESYMDDESSEQAPAEESNDLLTLLDQLERTLTTAGRVPMTGRLLVDEEALYTILDQIRTSGQAGIRQAREVEAEADQYAGQVLLALRDRLQRIQALLQEGDLAAE
jgi:hypothetical protein